MSRNSSVACNSEPGLRDIGLVLILPDTIRQGLVHDIGAYLGSLGAAVVAAVPDILTERHYRELYPNGPTAKTSANGRVYGRTLTTRLWGLDNSLAVLVCRPGGDADGRDLATVLHDCKGPSSFLQRRAGSLRDLSGLSDRCMSLIHTPDDWEETVGVAAMFYPRMDEVRLTSCRGERAIDWDVVAASRAWHIYGPESSRYEIGVRTILRCVATMLAAPVHCSGSRQDDLWLMYDGCAGWLAQKPLAPAAEHERYLGMCANLRRSLTNQVRNSSTPRFETINSLLDLMTNPELFDHQAGLRALSMLRDARFAMPDLERHLLLTLMTFLNDAP